MILHFSLESYDNMSFDENKSWKVFIVKFWVVDDVKCSTLEQVVGQLGLDEDEEEYHSLVHLVEQMVDGDVIDLDTMEIVCVEDNDSPIEEDE